VVGALDLPDGVADVAAVVPGGDRPERLVRPDGNDLLQRSTATPTMRKILTNMCSAL
jgi:hypothetical protein